MADIFISYSSQYRSETDTLAAFLRSEGYTVWTDAELESRGSYSQQIRAALDEARVLIVIWS